MMRTVKQTRATSDYSGSYLDDAASEIKLGALVAGVFFCGFLGFAALAPLAAAVVAPGVVVVSGSRQSVQHRDGGIISAIAVRDGQSVKKSDVLIEIAAPELVAQNAALFSQVIDLQLQRSLIDAERNNSSSLKPPSEWATLGPEDRELAMAALSRYRQRSSSVSQSWTETGARIQGYKDQIASVDRQQELLRQELEGIKTLADRQLAPLTRVRALERTLADLDGRRAELRAAIASAQQSANDDRRRIDARLSELLPQLTGVRAQLERTRLRAPVDGVVVGNIANTIGGVIGPGERVMEIVPSGQDLVIEAKVRPEDADEIRVGMASEVRITAFSGRNLPILSGRVQRVSADRLVDQQSGQPYFEARIVVPAGDLKLLGTSPSRQLRAGLPAEIVTPTHKRTLFQYLIDPLNQALWRSFRED